MCSRHIVVPNSRSNGRSDKIYWADESQQSKNDESRKEYTDATAHVEQSERIVEGSPREKTKW